MFQASRRDPPSLDSPKPKLDDQDKEKDKEDDSPVIIDKKDPILLALEKETNNFDPNVYLQKNDGQGEESLWLTIETYYQTRFENIRGSLVLKLDHLVFEAYKQRDKT